MTESSPSSSSILTFFWSLVQFSPQLPMFSFPFLLWSTCFIVCYKNFFNIPFTYEFICVRVCLYMVHITAHIWRSEGNLESVLCSHHVGVGDWTHTARSGSKLLYLQVISHLRYTDFNRWKSGPPVFCSVFLWCYWVTFLYHTLFVVLLFLFVCSIFIYLELILRHSGNT